MGHKARPDMCDRLLMSERTQSSAVAKQGILLGSYFSVSPSHSKHDPLHHWHIYVNYGLESDHFLNSEGAGRLSQVMEVKNMPVLFCRKEGSHI